ncbi:MAG TPA: CBS domain-containing protein [Myxococcaceae bacterium]|nr:CBS domain-containing protein [Myxococcaceae bacterium]
MVDAMIPDVRSCMSSPAVTIDADRSLSVAHRMMRDHGIRHLPVLEEGMLVGLLSEREVDRVEGRVDARGVAVRDVMVPAPFCVSPDANLPAVLREMVAQKYGSAVVVEGGRVVGMLTAIDTQDAFANWLERARHRH